MPKHFITSNRLRSFDSDKSGMLIQNLVADTVEMTRTLAPESGAVSNIDQTDGLRVTFANQDIVHLRPSGNAPELRCYAESGTAEAAKQLCDSCLAHVNEL